MALEYLSVYLYRPCQLDRREWLIGDAVWGDEAINALECLKSWQRDGLISAHHEGVQQLENTLDALCGAEMERKHEDLNG